MRTVVLVAGVLAATPATNKADISESVMACWTPAVAAESQSSEVEFELSADGQLIGDPTSPALTSADPSERVAAEAAVRAVRRCAPFNAPAGRYQTQIPTPMDAEEP